MSSFLLYVVDPPILPHHDEQKIYSYILAHVVNQWSIISSVILWSVYSSITCRAVISVCVTISAAYTKQPKSHERRATATKSNAEKRSAYVNWHWKTLMLVCAPSGALQISMGVETPNLGASESHSKIPTISLSRCIYLLSTHTKTFIPQASVQEVKWGETLCT